MVRVLVGVVAATALFIASASGVMARNPHCAGNSDNINLPSGHVNNFGGCK